MDAFVCFCFVTDLSLTATDPFDLTSGVGNDALNNANISGSAQTLVHILWQSHGDFPQETVLGNFQHSQEEEIKAPDFLC